VGIQSNLIFIVLSVLAIVSKYTSPNNLYRLFKLLPILFLIIWVANFGDIQENPYTRAILAGLCFSFIGDSLLLFPAQFKSGLFSFLIGHIWYMLGFLSGDWSLPILPTLIITILALGMFSQLYPTSGKLKIPVLVYILMIAGMGITSFGRLDALQSFSALIGSMGASLFMISDGVLGWNKFKNPFNLAEGIILITYYSGQWMIFYSTLM
jgi:alkenylglycerophosphocholine/alkenylglycerophosphoethanolamine hydrolase|tara:strand:+ start:997 stop:1626 length:630 start_codon:yes stop_codon:yes gene_type:complete